jgi:hypothetical protein
MLMMNERISTARRGEGNFPLAVECLLGEDAAQTTAAYFDLRWHSAQAPLAYSAKNKNFSFHIGRESEPEFFGCLFRAKKNVTLSLPSGRLSKKLERALCQALERGLLVTVYANAQSSDAPSLRRLRRLTEAGLTLKICGQRLGSEFAIADGQSVFMGSLPTSWKPWRSAAGPAFVMQNHKMSQEILSALESQVSVEINGVINRSH